MTPIDSAMLLKIAPAGAAKQRAIIAGIGQTIQASMTRYMIRTFLREAHFLAQICHESDGFNTLEEYASGAAYEGRTDLGNVIAGDGKRYKGRGLIQLTGRANYKKYGAILGLALEAQPELAVLPENAVLIACEYWKSRHINMFCDKDDLKAVTRRVNGGLNGLASRATYLRRAEAALGGKQENLVANVPSQEPVTQVAATAASSPFHTGAPALAPLHQGASGAAVSRLQRMLSDRGFSVMPDGEFGPPTVAAVLAFQEETGTKMDGIVGRQTWHALAAHAPPVYFA